MKLAKTRAMYFKCAILIISICFILGALAACLPFNICLPDTLDKGYIDDTAIEVTYPKTGELGQFADGFVYVYTDQDKIEEFRKGNLDYDITMVKVDVSQSRGSQENPYVIASEDDWEVFVKFCGTDLKNSQGKYFALSSDLDFVDKTFYPVAKFGGTFYGIGHKLSNINCSDWKYWNGSAYASIANTGQTNSGFGVFCSVTNATIVDLIEENYSFSNIPQTNASNGVGSLYGSFTGGLAGITYGDNNILNCHTCGEIRSLGAYSIITAFGGINGMHASSGNNKTDLFYRCSTDTSLYTSSSASMQTGCMTGGLVGQSWSSVVAFDCAVNLDFDYSVSGYCVYSSVVVGWSETTELFQFENCVGKIDIETSRQNYSGTFTGFRGNNVKFANMYVEGHIGTTTKTSMYAATILNGTTAPTSGISNINVVKTSDNYATPLSTSDGLQSISNEPKEWKGSSASTDMLAEAKNFFGKSPYSNIWDVDKIGGTYDPDNSPVRNYLVAKVTFKNLLSGDNDEIIASAPTADYKANDALPDVTNNTNFAAYVSSKANHVFLGWTDDATGSSDPFTTLPVGYFGEVTLYAVWGLPDSFVSANVKTSITSDKDKIEYDGVESITLTASVEHTRPSSGGMTNPSVKYFFKKDDEEDKIDSVTGKLSVKTVADSGKYTFDYKITDGSEPLWCYEGTHTAGKSIEIEKGKLKVENFKIDANTIPYYGKPLKLVEFSCVVKNKAGKEVPQESHKWEYQEVEKVEKGDNKTTIVIVPTDKDNYESSYTFEVEYASKALTMVFDMQKSISRELAVDVTYGQNYGAAEIMYLFRTAFIKALESGDRAYELVKNMAPYLAGAPITPDADGLPLYSGEFNAIDKIERIEVTFKEVSYKVTFNYNDKGATPNKVETYGYGQYLKRPTPDPTNGDMLFVGWYFDEVTIDENKDEVRTSRAWRFNSVGDTPQDRVTGELELTAKWLKADKLDYIKVELDSSKKFMAQTKIGEDDLVVTAYYSGELDGITKTQDIVLKWDKFKVNYATSDELLHVTDGGYEVTVSYQFGSGDPKEASVKINVLPIPVSTDKLTFSDKVVICTDEEKNETIDQIKGALPSQIKSVTYVYMLDGQEIPEEDVKGIGEYIVKAVFTMRSADFYAEPMTATLKIVRPTELDKPVFKGGAVYDGTEKRVEDYLDGFDSDFMELIGDGASAKDAGRYTVYVKLKEGSWSDGTTDNVTITWTIDKSTLIPNWDKWEFVSDGESSYAPIISGMADGLASGDKIDYANDFTYKIYDEDGNAVDSSQVSEVGSYRIVATINGDLGANYKLDEVSKEWYFVVVPKSGMSILTIEWGDTHFLFDGEVHYPTYVVKDRNGDEVTDNEILSQLKFTEGYKTKTERGTYTVKVTLSDTDNYFIRSGAVCVFKIVDENGNAPDYDPSDPNQRPSGNDPDSNGGSGTLDEILAKLKEIPLWQIIASVISIILIIIFLSKTAGYESKRKKFNKKADKLESSVYAGTFLGLAMTGWTAIACVLIGLAVVSLVIMLIAKSRCNKAEENYEEQLTEYERHKKEEEKEEARQRDENMRMMFMGMMGGNAGGNGGVAQGMPYMGGYGIGAEEIRGIISDTVTALLPGMQQLLPQQASTNDEVIQRLVENQELMMKKMSEQPAERIVEKEVAVTSAVNEDTIRQLIDRNDERMEQMMKTQEALIAKLLEKDNAPQVVEKVIEKEVPVEKIVEKVVEVPVEVEKIVEKEVPVEVEKIVEKEVRVEVPVEKVVEKEVKVKVSAPAKPKVEKAPRLTLDEAYALLSKEQKKYFDGLRDYALTKYKCKEKKSTYFVVYGQTSTNPLVKLTIKKDTTVALLKMEDEYMKDIRRDATGDGTKVRVKETEVVVSDKQAFETAKKMIDLRDDQIERYQELLREQRSMRNKK